MCCLGGEMKNNDNEYIEFKNQILSELGSKFKELSGSCDLDLIISIAISKIKNLNNLNKDERTSLIELGEALSEAFKRLGDDDFFKLAFVAPYVGRIEQQHTIIKQWYDKENEVMNDDKLTDEQKERMVADMAMLRDQEVQSMAES